MPTTTNTTSATAYAISSLVGAQHGWISKVRSNGIVHAKNVLSGAHFLVKLQPSADNIAMEQASIKVHPSVRKMPGALVETNYAPYWADTSCLANTVLNGLRAAEDWYLKIE